MKTMNFEELLNQSHFFKDVSPQYVKLIASCGKNQVFKPDQWVARAGTPSNHFFVIRKGKLAIEVHMPARGHRLLQTLKEGDIVGWSWLFPPYEWAFDIRSLETTRVISIDGKCLRGKCDLNPEMGYELMRKFAEIIAERLKMTQVQMMDVYGKPNN